MFTGAKKLKRKAGIETDRHAGVYIVHIDPPPFEIYFPQTYIKSEFITQKDVISCNFLPFPSYLIFFPTRIKKTQKGSFAIR